MEILQRFQLQIQHGISSTELDNIYKKYGTLSSLIATFIVSGSGYSNSKTCTIMLKRKSKDY